MGCRVLSLEAVQLFICHHGPTKTFFSVELDWNLPIAAMSLSVTFTLRIRLFFLISGEYDSYPHAMKGIISIQSFDVVINIVCNILDKLR